MAIHSNSNIYLSLRIWKENINIGSSTLEGDFYQLTAAACFILKIDSNGEVKYSINRNTYSGEIINKILIKNGFIYYVGYFHMDSGNYGTASVMKYNDQTTPSLVWHQRYYPPQFERTEFLNAQLVKDTLVLYGNSHFGVYANEVLVENTTNGYYFLKQSIENKFYSVNFIEGKPKVAMKGLSSNYYAVYDSNVVLLDPSLNEKNSITTENFKFGTINFYK